MPETNQDARSADTLDRALGTAIRLRRRSLHMTQEQLASACGVSFQQVQKYENGGNRISFSRLVHIARALNCRVTDLTSAIDEPQLEPADFEFLELMALPGAVALLKRYEGLSADSRRLLLELLASL